TTSAARTLAHDSASKAMVKSLGMRQSPGVTTAPTVKAPTRRFGSTPAGALRTPLVAALCAAEGRMDYESTRPASPEPRVRAPLIYACFRDVDALEVLPAPAFLRICIIRIVGKSELPRGSSGTALAQRTLQAH